MRIYASPLCLFPTVFAFSPYTRPWVTFKRPFHEPTVFHTIMWLWQGAWQVSHVRATTSQLLLRDITADNLPWIFIRHRCCVYVRTHTHTHRWSSYTTMFLWSKRAHYLPVVLQSSAEITNQLRLSDGGSLSACLSTPSPFAGNTRSEVRLIPFLSPNVDSRVCSERGPLIALTINEKVCLIYL